MRVFKEDDGNYGILFTKIIDLSDIDNEEDLNKVADKSFWEKKASKEMLKLTENVYNDFIDDKEKMKLNYVQNYIGISENGVANNFICFVQKKGF